MAAEARAQVNQKSYLGAEAVFGLAVAATKSMPSLMIEPERQFRNQFYRRQGSIVPTTGVRHREWATGQYNGALDYEEVTYVLAGLFGAPAPTNLSGSAYEWVFSPATANFGEPKTFTQRMGDSQASSIMPGMHFNSLELNVGEEQAEISGSVLALPVVESGGPISATTDEVQQLTITGAPTGGTFTLTYAAQETTDIPYNATAAEVQTALQTLSSMADADVRCFGGQLPSNAINLHFLSALGGTNVNAITVDDAGLTGGTSPEAAITTLTAGAGAYTEVPQVPVSVSEADVYIDASYGALGTSKYCEAKELALTIPELRQPDFRLCRTYESMKAAVIQAIEGATGRVTLVKSPAVIALVEAANAKQKPTYFIRKAFTGPVITGAYTYKLWIDLAVQLREPRDRRDVAGGIYGYDFDYQVVGNASLGGPLKVTLVNTRSAL